MFEMLFTGPVIALLGFVGLLLCILVGLVVICFATGGPYDSKTEGSSDKAPQ
jgi:hypothetical protein